MSVVLTRFPHAHLDALASLAASSERVAQLAQSHPLLFFALASGYGTPAQRREAIRRTELGQSLHDVADALALPLSLRRVPPEALSDPLVHADLSEQAGQLLAGRIGRQPRMGRKAELLRAAFYGTRVADEPFGVWLSDARRVPVLPSDLSLLRPLALFAWFSRNHRLTPAPLWHRPWAATMTARAAVRETQCWLDHLKLHVFFSADPIGSPWAEGGTVDGFDIVPLVHSADLVEEAVDMDNCLYSYADRLFWDQCRLFGVRHRGAKVGTVELRLSDGVKPSVAQFRGPANAWVGLEACHAVEVWAAALPDVVKRADGRREHRLSRFRELLGIHARACRLDEDFWPASPDPAAVTAELIQLASLYTRSSSSLRMLAPVAAMGAAHIGTTLQPPLG